MKVVYFPDTDTLLVEFSDGSSEDSRDLDENTLAEYDRNGRLISMTIEHASERVDLSSFSYSNSSLVPAA
jgi:uncharacterized protein YuzE